MSDTDCPTPATRDSWSPVHPLPVAYAPLVVERVFTQDEYAHIACGLVPEQMEDKWFIFPEALTLFFHRSWTGFCIFEVILAQQGACYAIAEVRVNRDPAQYGGSNDAFDQQLLLFLIDHLLLGEPRRLPIPGDVPAGIAIELYYQHVAGAGHKTPKPLTLADLWRWFWSWLWWLIKRR